jgi:3',5'-cyclic AMP phosphodiesterase CpdA
MRLTAVIPIAILAGVVAAEDLRLPNQSDSFHFAVIGDTGTGARPEYETGERLAAWRKQFKFDVVVMMGDNIYGSQKPADFKKKFEDPYKALLEAGVKFYASLGNHDDPTQRSYKLFNMGGERYYSFKPHKGVQFFALDSNYMDKRQLEWLEKELSGSNAEWKIVFCHHPLYSSGGKHGSDMELRQVLEPMFVKYHVALALAGHDHFYERIKPQRGINYFVVGGSAKLREGNVRRADFAAASFDTDNSFLLVEIEGDELHYQAVSRTGKTIDAGAFARGEKGAATASGQ